ncbi:MAG TPA: hypothetical protein VGW33_15165 [Terriglobia bacterium]|nr:hypothetical protein [Terriglobia bacterium]
MTMPKSLLFTAATFFAFVAVSQSRPLQDQQPSAVPGATAQSALAAQDADQDQQGPNASASAATPVEDTRPLAGAEVGVQIPGARRGYLLPSFSFAEVGDTNNQIVPGGSTFATASIPVARMELDHVGRRTDFAADYLGGALLYNSVSQSDTTFQQFGFSEKYTGRQWNLLLSDRFSYLPEAEFGFGGISELGSFGIGSQLGLGGGLGQLNPAFGPGQSILTGQAGRYTNVAVGQAQYRVTARTSFTGIAAVANVQFQQNSFISGNDLTLTGAVDHSLSARDSLSVAYTFSALRFNGLGEAINSYVIQAGYGRRITGRLSFRLLGGPEITQIASGGVTFPARLYASGQGELSYHLERSDFSLAYRQFIEPGSGVLAGALTSAVTASWNRRLTQSWSGYLYAGYGRNAGLQQSIVNSNGLFNYENGGLRLSRNWGRSFTLFALYTVQYQSSNIAFPIFSGNPGRVVVVHTFGVGLDVHSRPFGI